VRETPRDDKSGEVGGDTVGGVVKVGTGIDGERDAPGQRIPPSEAASGAEYVEKITGAENRVSASEDSSA
jgi:hypothetical protein